MYNLVVNKGYPALIYQQLITLPGAALPQNIIGTKLQEQVGLIYGVSINVGGVDVNNQLVITAAQAGELFLVLKQGSSNFVDQYRLDNFIYVLPGNVANPMRFCPLNITDKISLDQSYILNPTAIVNRSIVMNFHYITKNDLAKMKQQGLYTY